MLLMLTATCSPLLGCVAAGMRALAAYAISAWLLAVTLDFPCLAAVTSIGDATSDV